MASEKYQKKDIIDDIANKSEHVSKNDVQTICNNFIKQIRNKLVQGEVIEIRGFGKFYSSISKRQTGRDINSGKLVTFPKRRVVHFKASTSLRKAVREEK